MNIKPLGNRVLIKVDEIKEKKIGGIYLPENSKQIPNTAEVVAVGPGKSFKDKTLPLTVQVGDKVIYKISAATEIPVDEEGSYLIISEEDIYAIVE